MMIEQLLNRLPTEATDEREIVTIALTIPENLKAKAAELAADVNLSEVGRQAKMKALATDPLTHLRQVKARADAMAASVANLKKAMQPTPPDRADAVLAGLHREIRDWLRAQPSPNRFRAASENPDIAAAVLHVPAPLTGLSQEQINLVREKQIEREHGPQLRGLAQREEILEVVTAALQIASSEFSKVSGLSEAEIA